MDPIQFNAWLAKEGLAHERALRGYLSRFLKDVADIEDVIQETYGRLLALNDTTRNAVRNWRAFLFTTARNAALDRIRRAPVVSLDALAEMDGSDVVDQAPGVDEALNARQELALLADAIASLPDRCREVLTLRRLYGLPQREVAERLGISESTVEKHVAYGVRLCAERLFAQRSQQEVLRAVRGVWGRKRKRDGK